MKKIVFLVAALSLMGLSQAQDTVNGVFNGNVVVTGSYKPVLEEISKLNIAPVMTDTATTLQHSFQYAISPKRMTSLFIPSRIKAARVVGEPTTRLYNNYVRVGMGNNWAPLLDVYYNSTRHQVLSYGAYLTHESSWGKIGKYVDSIPYNPNYYGPNHWAMTHVGAFAKYIVKEKIQLSSDLNFNNDYNLFYGFNDSVAHAAGFPINDSLKSKDLRSMYNYLVWNVGVKNLQTDVNKLGYMANAKVANLWGNYHQNEFNLNLTGDIHYGFPLLSEYKGVAYLHADWQAFKSRWISDTIAPMGITAPTVIDTIKNVRNLVTLNPYVDFIFNNFNIHAGLSVGIDGYSSDTTKSMTKIYPDVVISKSLMNESLNLSVGAIGGMEVNSWNTIRLVNPYLLPGCEQLEATSHYDVFAKMRMNFNKKLRLDAHAQYSIIQDDLSFIDTGALHNIYKPVFVDVNKLSVGGDITFVNDEMISIALGGNYYLYSGKDEKNDLSFRLYRPNFDAHLDISMNYYNKWLFKVQGLLLGKMYAHAMLNTETNLMELDPASELPMRTGVNMEIEYRHNKALSFFARFDNIVAQRYFYWMNYPSHKFQCMLGLTYTIH